jgi:hypothetical protein
MLATGAISDRAPARRSRLWRAARLSAAWLLFPAAAAANAVTFDGGWREQRFSLFSSNDYTQAGDSLRVASDGTVSLLWTALPDVFRDARRAAWRWSVDRSPPPTDLTRKGGDDRALSLYFVFLPEARADAMRGRSVMDLLDADDVRVLMYVVGGARGDAAVLPSPYLGARGRTIALRPAGAGAWEETVDLSADFRRAFGEEATALVGLAVSADSDDTGTAVRAELSRLTIR